MIYIVIGQSGSGKTTFVKNKFLNGETKIVEDVVPYTICENTAALGRYWIGKRTEGTDTLSYNSQERIKELLPVLIKKEYDIVMEGDRINTADMFDYVKRLGQPVKLYLVKCSLLTSMERLQEAGSTITISFVKATKTKALKNFSRYRGVFNGEIIETEGQSRGQKGYKAELQ